MCKNTIGRKKGKRARGEGRASSSQSPLRIHKPNTNIPRHRAPNNSKMGYCCGTNLEDDRKCWWTYIWSWVLLICDGICLLGFILALLPGFVRFAYYYSISSDRKSVRYGTASCRQSLDVYYAVEDSADSYSTPSWRQEGRGSQTSHGPEDSLSEQLLSNDHATNNEEATAASPNAVPRRPVVLFFPGGAWMIGYKMWAALTARVLRQFNIVTVVSDYRNRLLPGVTMSEMVDDVTLAIEWTMQNIHKYGGDPSRITVVGQSAGGHLATTALLRRAIRLHDEESSNQSSSSSSNTDPSITWKPTDLCGLIAVSAPFHLPQMRSTFRKHGLSDKVLESMFLDGSNQNDYDPLVLVQRHWLESSSEGKPLPPINVWHGARDATVPWECAEEFAQNLEQATDRVTFQLHPTWTHTDGILEGPMSGDHSFHKDLVQAVEAWSRNDSGIGNNAGPWSDDHEILKPLWTPRELAKLGMYCTPF